MHSPARQSHEVLEGCILAVSRQSKSAVATTSSSVPGAPNRISFAKLREPLEVPGLLDVQTESFEWLIGSDALARDRHRPRRRRTRSAASKRCSTELSPIEDFSGSMSLSFSDPRFDEVKAPVDECKDKDMTYAAPLFVTAEFINNNTGEIKSQTVFMGDFPMMTEKGTFIINGTERVVVSPAGPLAGRVLRRDHRQVHREDAAQRQGDPRPRRVAGVRRRQARHRRCAHRPQAPSAGHRAAQGAGLDQRADRRALRLLRDHDGDAGEGQHRRHRRGAAGHLPQAAPGRAADQGVRADPAGEPVLQGEALRPGPGGPLQGQQEARPERRPADHRRRR